MRRHRCWYQRITTNTWIPSFSSATMFFTNHWWCQQRCLLKWSRLGACFNIVFKSKLITRLLCSKHLRESTTMKNIYCVVPTVRLAQGAYRTDPGSPVSMRPLTSRISASMKFRKGFLLTTRSIWPGAGPSIRTHVSLSQPVPRGRFLMFVTFVCLCLIFLRFLINTDKHGRNIYDKKRHCCW